MKTQHKETDAERHKKDGNVTRRQMTKGSLRKKRERQTLLEKNVEREMKKRDRRKEKETQNV